MKGEEVEYLSLTSGAWYPAKVWKANDDGSFDLDKKAKAQANRIRKKLSHRFHVGDWVEYESLTYGWTPGRVLSIKPDNTFDLSCRADVPASKMRKLQVRVHTKGFIERAYRLLFHYGEHYPNSGQYNEDWKLSTGPKHICIVANVGGGTDKVTDESCKVCAPYPSGALVAFPYAQHADEQSLITMRSKKNKQSHWNFEPEPPTEYGNVVDPFIFKRKNSDTWALVQSWGNNFNEEYQNTRKIVPLDQPNPNPKVFEEQAVDDFCVSMERLFGDINLLEATAQTKQHVMYTISETDNTSTVYIGQSEVLMEYFQKNEEAMKALEITELKPPLSFTATISYPKKPDKACSTKTFEMMPRSKYAIYTKQGWESMAVPVPWDLFTKEKELKL